jgi:hypothetical protein
VLRQHGISPGRRTAAPRQTETFATTGLAAAVIVENVDIDTWKQIRSDRLGPLLDAGKKSNGIAEVVLLEGPARHTGELSQ